jgi:hypothetical protein
MKLFLCSKCSEIFNLSHEYRECKGGHGGGKYVDSLNAKVWGPSDTIFVLGFTNGSLIDAIGNQKEHGDLPATMLYGGDIVSPGRRFDAFIIPDSASSVERVDKRFS